MYNNFNVVFRGTVPTVEAMNAIFKDESTSKSLTTNLKSINTNTN